MLEHASISAAVPASERHHFTRYFPHVKAMTCAADERSGTTIREHHEEEARKSGPKGERKFVIARIGLHIDAAGLVHVVEVQVGECGVERRAKYAPRANGQEAI